MYWRETKKMRQERKQKVLSLEPYLSVYAIKKQIVIPKTIKQS